MIPCTFTFLKTLFPCLERFTVLLSRVDELEALITSGEVKQQGGQFEWIDSVLVKALEQGHWLLIDNVNFCR